MSLSRQSLALVPTTKLKTNKRKILQTTKQILTLYNNKHTKTDKIP